MQVLINCRKESGWRMEAVDTWVVRRAPDTFLATFLRLSNRYTDMIFNGGKRIHCAATILGRKQIFLREIWYVGRKSTVSKPVSGVWRNSIHHRISRFTVRNVTMNNCETGASILPSSDREEAPHINDPAVYSNWNWGNYDRSSCVRFVTDHAAQVGPFRIFVVRPRLLFYRD